VTHSLSEAAKQLGVSTSLIRRYEKEFDLNFARTEQGRCMLTDQDLTNLRIIRSFRQQGLPFDAIKEQLRPQESVELVSAETHVEGPEIREVLSALVRRQDELESVVTAQQAHLNAQQERIEALLGENQKLLARHEQLGGLLAQPTMPAEELSALRERVSGLEAQAETALLEASKDEVIRRLQRRLLELEGTIAAQMDHPDPEGGMLDELASAIQELATQQRKRWWEFWK
jgi:DNA-binding transcriptional MerR regulator